MNRAAEAWASLPFFTDVFRDGDAAPRIALADVGAVALHFMRDDEAVAKWRFPITREERGAAAIGLPVDAVGALLSPIDGLMSGPIADVIALPIDGGRALSFTGFTASAGLLAADEHGRVILYAGGRAWLQAWLDRCRAFAADTPDHLIARLHLPFPPPAGTLLLEPAALEWRVTRHDCVIPRDCTEIVCPDSRRLAETILALAKKPERKRPLPVVRGPSRTSERAAA